MIQDYTPDIKNIQKMHASKESEKRIQDEFNNVTKVLECYVEGQGVVLQCLASRYLGGGMLDPTYIVEEHPLDPHHSSQ